MPIVFDPTELGFDKGQEVSAKELANAVYKQLPYKKVARGGSEFYGLEEALSGYGRNWFIAKAALNFPSDSQKSKSNEVWKLALPSFLIANLQWGSSGLWLSQFRGVLFYNISRL